LIAGRWSRRSGKSFKVIRRPRRRILRSMARILLRRRGDRPKAWWDS